jgi:hypothetical protein
LATAPYLLLASPLYVERVAPPDEGDVGAQWMIQSTINSRHLSSRTPDGWRRRESNPQRAQRPPSVRAATASCAQRLLDTPPTGRRDGCAARPARTGPRSRAGELPVVAVDAGLDLGSRIPGDGLRARAALQALATDTSRTVATTTDRPNQPGSELRRGMWRESTTSTAAIRVRSGHGPSEEQELSLVRWVETKGIEPSTPALRRWATAFTRTSTSGNGRARRHAMLASIPWPTLVRVTRRVTAASASSWPTSAAHLTKLDWRADPSATASGWEGCHDVAVRAARAQGHQQAVGAGGI